VDQTDSTVYNMALRDDSSASSTSSAGSDRIASNIFGEMGANLLTAKVPSVALRSGHGGKDIYLVRMSFQQLQRYIFTCLEC
jgi:hypothetical protein